MAPRYIMVGEPPAPGKYTFSAVEIRHILVSIVVLIVAFTMAFTGAVWSLANGDFSLRPFLTMMGIVTVAVLTEFLLHELAHKVTAQKYGCWSEYRYDQTGLLLTIVTGFFGYVFAAPGVVWHSGNVTTEQEGKISAAGPATNLALSGIFFLLWYKLPVTGTLALLLGFVTWINVWVGAFNLVPVRPLDGSKIWKWSIPAYISMWAAFIMVGIGLYYTGFLSLLGF